GLRATKQYQQSGRAVRTEFRWQGLVEKLKALNLFNNKHIPEAYKRASVPQRLALMAGLIDTDGSCDPRGRVRISTGLKVLADGIMEIAESLGWRPYLMVFDAPGYGAYASSNGVHYQVGFNPTHD